MILRDATIKYKGYDPEDLSKGSGKRVCVSCDQCGRVRWIEFKQSNKLCRSCSKLGKKYLTKKIKLVCYQCGCEFIVQPHRKNAKFCSYECMGKYYSIHNVGKESPSWKPKVILTCKQCGRDFEVMINESNKIFCDQKCYGKWRSENLVGKLNPMFGIHLNGELNPNWQGGLSFENYPKEFNKLLKTKIRNNYNNCDYTSGIYKDIYNNSRKLDVHHIDYDKQNNNENNLIPLSRSNHTKTNYNKLFWNRLFTYSLEIDKWYYGGLI